jgi:hypothetical protein
VDHEPPGQQRPQPRNLPGKTAWISHIAIDCVVFA